MEKFKQINGYYMPQDCPVVFQDGSKVYDMLKAKYITHKKGAFIYAPSGVGKTFYIQKQKENHFIDGDYLWGVCGALPIGEWWLGPIEMLDVYESRADFITEQSRNMGFFILGASRVNTIPDAIVLPPLDVHISYLKKREQNYDGGLKSDDIEKIKRARERALKAKGPKTLVFQSVEEACAHFLSLEEA